MGETQGEGQPEDAAQSSLPVLAVVAGYGVPGRTVADQLCRQGVTVCVIELNARTVERVSRTSIDNLRVTVGDVADEDTLRRAGIEQASLFAITVPVDTAVLQAIRIARRLSPRLHIMARCRYVSTALEAARLGANEVVSEEQVVAEEFGRLIKGNARWGITSTSSVRD
jgi:CPA2 family monovalent cation:H+ antiporter-2